MTEQHPLTDEIIEEIAQFEPDLTDPLRLNRTNDMRAVADWQLEQVIEWIKNCRDYDLFYIKDRALMNFKMRRELKKAMRPQGNNS